MREVGRSHFFWSRFTILDPAWKSVPDAERREVVVEPRGVRLR